MGKLILEETRQRAPELLSDKEKVATIKETLRKVKMLKEAQLCWEKASQNEAAYFRREYRKPSPEYHPRLSSIYANVWTCTQESALSRVNSCIDILDVPPLPKSP